MVAIATCFSIIMCSDPTKFELGIFSIFFDVIIMFQHYMLSRSRKDRYKPIDD